MGIIAIVGLDCEAKQERICFKRSSMRSYEVAEEDSMLGIEGKATVDRLTEEVLRVFKSCVRASIVVMVGRVSVLVWVERNSVFVTLLQLSKLRNWQGWCQCFC